MGLNILSNCKFKRGFEMGEPFRFKQKSNHVNSKFYVDFKVNYDRLWYFSRILVTPLSFGISLIDIFLAHMNSKKWHKGTLDIRKHNGNIELFLWERGLVEVFRRKTNFIRIMDEKKWIIEIRDRRILRRKVYQIRFHSEKEFIIVKSILPKS